MQFSIESIFYKSVDKNGLELDIFIYINYM